MSTLNYNEFDKEETKPLVELHKTDYNNYANLSHFVDEYYKAQALIKECDNLYRSFLMSKLLSYSKLTNSVYKKQAYRFFSVKPYIYGQNGTPYNPNVGNYRFSDVAKDFGFTLDFTSLNGLYSPKIDISILRLSELLGTLDLLEQYKNDENCKVYYTLEKDSYNYRVTPYRFVFKDCQELQYNMYGDCQVYKERKKYSWSEEYESDNTYKNKLNSYYKKAGFNNEKEIEDYITKFAENFKIEWAERCRSYVEKVLDYIGYDNIMGVGINYEILDNATHMLNSIKGKLKRDNYPEDYSKEIMKAFEKKVAKLYKPYEDAYNNIKPIYNIKINILDFIEDKTELIKSIQSHIYSTGNWCNDMSDIFNKLIPNEKLIEFVYPQIEDIIHSIQQFIDIFKDEDINQKLYIIDEKNNAHFFCYESELPLVKIKLDGRDLICAFEEDDSHYSKIGQYTKHHVITRIVDFNVDDNSVKGFSESHSNYETSVKYR